jgi:hypothetical protein
MLRQIRDIFADHVRQTYIAARRSRESNDDTTDFQPGPELDGGVDHRGVHHQAIWPALMRKLLRAEVVVVQYIYLSMMKTDGPVEPHEFLLDCHIAAYQSVTPRRDRTIALTSDRKKLDVDLSIARFLAEEFHETFDPKLALVTALCDEEFSPVFRFCVAVKEGLDRFAESNRLEALVQMVWFFSEYDSWGEFIPRTFREEAAMIRQWLLEE